jgi:ParB family chromosome partitioning protein
MSARRLSAASLVGLEDFAPAKTPNTPTAAAAAPSPTRPPQGTQLVVKLPLTSIIPNRDQPRRDFDPVALQGLANSITDSGLIQPIRVRPAEDGADAQFELVAGERRWRACALAGREHIEAIIEGVDNETGAEMALVENMARDDLNPMEEAHGCARLRDRGISVAAIGRRTGRDRTVISHLIRLLELPDQVQAHIAHGTLSAGHGRVLLQLADHADRIDVGERCARAGWTVRELERQVDARNATQPTPPTQPPADEAAALATLTESITPFFGPSPVSIVPRRRGSYRLHVDFEDFDTLTAAVTRLREQS